MGPRFLLALVSGCSIFSSVVTSSSSGLSHCECRQPRVTVGTVSVFSTDGKPPSRMKPLHSSSWYRTTAVVAHT